jgi:Ran GTPase-activating protein (RanGAP) involved in mRNA processing and transport
MWRVEWRNFIIFLTISQFSSPHFLAGIKVLLEALKSIQLKTLYLYGNILGNDGAQHLADFLHEDEYLQVLDLNGNSIGDLGSKYIAEGLEHNSALLDLNMEWNELGYDAAKAFAKMLRHNQALKRLSLYRNINMGIEGYTEIAKGLEANTALTELELQWRYTTEDGKRMEYKGE